MIPHLEVCMQKLLFLMLMKTMCAFSEELIVLNANGDALFLDVSSEQSVGEILQIVHKSANTSFRDYYIPPTPSEKQDIAYIVNTMGMSSLAKIAKSKSSLKSAGNRVNHVHPLQFLLTVFLDERMKASMQALNGRSWLWDEFIDGLKKSLNEESARENMQVEFVQDFTLRLNVPFDSIYALVQQKKWDNLVKTLITLLPRNSDANRYDM